MKTKSVFLIFMAVLLIVPSSLLAQGVQKRKAQAAKNAPTEASPAVQDATIAAHRKALLSKIQTPPLSPFHPQLPKRIELPNGMIIFLQEDHELPLIDGSITIRGGSRVEPAAKVGLIGVYGQVWRTGGTRTRT